MDNSLSAKHHLSTVMSGLTLQLADMQSIEALLTIIFQLVPKVRLFGGAVRDLILGQIPQDLDFLIDTEESLKPLQTHLEEQDYLVNVRHRPLFNNQNSLDPHQPPADGNHYNLVCWTVSHMTDSSSPIKIDWVQEIVNEGADFTCNMLTLNVRGGIGIWHQSPTYESSLDQIISILRDIQQKQLRVVQAEYYFRSNPTERQRIRLFHRALKMIYRGWKPVDWQLSDLQMAINPQSLPIHSPLDHQKEQEKQVAQSDSERESFFPPPQTDDLDRWLARITFEYGHALLPGSESERKSLFKVATPSQQTELPPSNSRESSVCAICLEKYVNCQFEDLTIITQCQHQFHWICIYLHLIKNSSYNCPCCRTMLIQ